VYRLEGLAVVVDESKTSEESSEANAAAGDITVRGDELKEVEHLQKIVEVLETEHLDDHADLVKEHVRSIVAKQLNELDGFDR